MIPEICSVREVKDIAWLHRMADGLAVARETRKALVLKPLGQGLDDFDGW